MVVPEELEADVDELFARLEELLGPFPVAARRRRPGRRVRARRVAGGRPPDARPGAHRGRDPAPLGRPTLVVATDAETSVDELLDAIEQGTLVLSPAATAGRPGGRPRHAVHVGRPPGPRRRRPRRPRRAHRPRRRARPAGAAVRGVRRARGPRSSTPRRLARTSPTTRTVVVATSSAPPRSCARSCASTSDQRSCRPCATARSRECSSPSWRCGTPAAGADRRLALGNLVLPVDPAPGFGGLLLGAVVAAHIRDVDDDCPRRPPPDRPGRARPPGRAAPAAPPLPGRPPRARRAPRTG